MAERINKQDIIQQVEQSYSAFEAGLATLDAEQMTAPALPGGWSVKDTLAHLSVWHRRALDIIDPTQPPRVPNIPPGGINEETINDFNTQIYAQHKDQPLSEALAAFRASYHDLLASVQRLPEEDLTRPLLGESTVLAIIAGNTYAHYPEHLEAIQTAFPQA